METVTSADGTEIAYERTGRGRALIVCLGAFCTRQSFVAPEMLTDRYALITYDRRGRGDSGDTPPYAPEKEYADLAAVAAAHFICDCRRWASGASWPPRPILVDQSFHLLQLALISRILAGSDVGYPLAAATVAGMAVMYGAYMLADRHSQTPV